MNRSTDDPRPRVIHREPVAEGFSVETGVLSSTQNDAVSRAVGPGATAVQRTYLAAFELPLDEALAELDSRIASRTATA